MVIRACKGWHLHRSPRRLRRVSEAWRLTRSFMLCDECGRDVFIDAFLTVASRCPSGLHPLFGAPCYSKVLPPRESFAHDMDCMPSRPGQGAVCISGRRPVYLNDSVQENGCHHDEGPFGREVVCRHTRPKQAPLASQLLVDCLPLQGRLTNVCYPLPSLRQRLCAACQAGPARKTWMKHFLSPGGSVAHKC